MLLAKQATSALAEGDNIKYLELASQAFAKEKEAAMDLLGDFEAEPTRSVLFRSAANIAFNIGDFTEAKKLSHLALAGSPFDEIKEELQQLLEESEMAIENQAGKIIGIENAYIETLREKAIHLKLEPVESRYSKAIILDYITDFLKNIQNCFSSFSEVNFKKRFHTDDFPDYGKVLNLFKKDTKALCVGLRFRSFGVSVAVDTSLQNYRDISSPKFKEFKNTLFDDFKEEVLLADFNSTSYQENIEKKYTEEERKRIFTPIIDSFKEKSKYRISIVDREFKNTLKTCPVVTSRTISVLKPSLEKEKLFDDSEVLIKRTLELTNAAGQRGEKILTENLEYAEFKIALNNLNADGKEAFFRDAYELKVIFNHGVFLIDDEYYKIYVEGNDFKDVEKTFARELISKFSLLLDKEALTEDKLSLDEKEMLDIFKISVVKAW
jgi:hypothetical protein